MARETKKPELPSALLTERHVVRLFLTYLRQPTTQDALLAEAQGKGQLAEFSNYLHTLNVRVGGATRGDNDLRELITVAPVFNAVAWTSRRLSVEVLPADARPSLTCVAAVMREYHAWVRRQAGRR